MCACSGNARETTLFLMMIVTSLIAPIALLFTYNLFVDQSPIPTHSSSKMHPSIYHVFHYLQEDLVQIAFAGPDLEDDFAKMKGAAIDEELGIDEKRNKILQDGETFDVM